MSDQSLVSIVTPAFNQADYIRETIESVLAQDYGSIEYFVLDDGSTDSTSEVLESFRGQISFERHENMGQVRTLNKGWSKCSGKYIGYLSSDDILMPTAIRELVAVLDADPSVVCVFPDSHLIDSSSRVIKRNVCRPFDLEDTLVRQECYIGPGALFRREAFEQLGGWSPNFKLAPDREFWVRISALGRIAMCSSVLAGYRMHPKSISYKDVSEETSMEYLRFLDDYFSSAIPSSRILARKDEAYGFAYYLMARNSFRGARYKRGLEFYKRARELYPPLGEIKYKIQFVRNVISRPVRRIASTIVSLFRKRA